MSDHVEKLHDCYAELNISNLVVLLIIQILMINEHPLKLYMTVTILKSRLNSSHKNSMNHNYVYSPRCIVKYSAL